MSKPDVRAIVDLHIDFIAQNLSDSTMQCHYTDPWGPGQEGLQDCVLDRYHLCAQGFDPSFEGQHWFDFTNCLFRNQVESDVTDDDLNFFNATLRYCSYVNGYDYDLLKECAESEFGTTLFMESHEREKVNPNVGAKGFHHPTWIIVNGVDYGDSWKDDTVDWTQLVCDAYKGPKKPASCVTVSTTVPTTTTSTTSMATTMPCSTTPMSSETMV